MKSSVIFLVMVLVCSFACAQETQLELNEKAASEAKLAADSLDSFYKKILIILSDEQKKLLIRSQEFWIKYRDAEVEFEESGYGEGSIRPLIHWNAMSRLTKIRAAELTEEYKSIH